MFSVWRQDGDRSPRRRSSRGRAAAFRPQVETLETRAVPNAAPQIALPATVQPQNQTVAIAALFTDPDSASWSATVDYGDGSGTQPLSLHADKSFTLNHGYVAAGPHRIIVEITDGDGQTGRAEVVVEDGGLNALPTFPTEGRPPLAQPLPLQPADLFAPLPMAPQIAQPLTQLDPFAAGVANSAPRKLPADLYWSNFGQAEATVKDPMQITPASFEAPAPLPVEQPMRNEDGNSAEPARQNKENEDDSQQVSCTENSQTEPQDRHQLLATGILLPWQPANIVILVLAIGWTSRGRRLKRRCAKANCFRRRHHRTNESSFAIASNQRSRPPPWWMPNGQSRPPSSILPPAPLSFFPNPSNCHAVPIIGQPMSQEQERARKIRK